jgi:hypothetical protein
MGIVLLMARDATGGQFVAKKADVTGVTIDFHVGSAQRILCFVVIEPRLFPVILPVTRFTFAPVAASVNILNFVACDASRADTAVSLAGMTERTFNGLVGPFEWKLCFGMVEDLDASPIILAVAALARFAKSTLMRIDRFMTIHAPAGRTAEFSRGIVTLVAGNRDVSIVEREIREAMIKCLAIELNNVSPPTLVISVAISALLFRRVRLASVKAPARQPIRRNLLVACKAQVALRLSRKWHVTLRALLFELGMALDERPGSNKLLDHILRIGCPYCCHC